MVLSPVYRFGESIQCFLSVIGLVTEVSEEVFTEGEDSHVSSGSDVELQLLPKENRVLPDGVTLLQSIEQEGILVGIEYLDVDETIHYEDD